MIEEIREKVIIANNPKCKTYEEALEGEVSNGCQFMQCQFILTDQDNHVVNSDYIAKYYHHNYNYKILGLPLTLERVMIALNFYTSNRDTVYTSDGRVIYECILLRQPFTVFEIVREIDWQPNNPPENKSEKTIKEIYGILCV